MVKDEEYWNIRKKEVEDGLRQKESQDHQIEKGISDKKSENYQKHIDDETGYRKNRYVRELIFKPFLIVGAAVVGYLVKDYFKETLGWAALEAVLMGCTAAFAFALITYGVKLWAAPEGKAQYQDKLFDRENTVDKEISKRVEKKIEHEKLKEEVKTELKEDKSFVDNVMKERVHQKDFSNNIH